MNEERIKIDLTGVPKTLLLPLLGRALFSQRKNPPLRDMQAIKLVQSLDYDFENLLKQLGSHSPTLWWIARAYHFDHAINTYLNSHPSATVVNLGAGLDTTFYRVDNGKLTWIDIDLPEVIVLRKKLLQPAERVHQIEKSILDYSWINDVKKFGGNVIFIGGGFFMYFTEEQVKSLMIKMADHFPQSELIFDSIPKRHLDQANTMLAQVNMKNAVLQWGLDNSKELETWSPKIKIISRIPFFKDIKTKYDFSLLTRIKMFFYDSGKMGGIIHLMFL